MAEALIEQGCEKLVLCSGGASFGVSMFVDRKAGFEELWQRHRKPVQC